MAQPGTVFTASDSKEYLKNYNKNYLGETTWLNAFNSIDKNYGAAVTDLAIAEGVQQSANLQEYSDNIADAYKAAMAQQNQVLASNLGQGFKNQLSADIDANLDTAYNSYLQNYMANKQSIQSNYLTNVNGIYEAHQAATEEVDKLLNEQAQNTANYLNAYFDYAEVMLNKLYEENPDVLSEDQYQDYVTREMVDGQLQVTGVRDINEIRDMMFNSTDNGYELNDRGKDFFRQMQQQGLEENGYSFGDYLYENDADLFDWSMDTNEYDSTYSDLRGNTNRASALGAIGLADDGGFVSSGNYEWKGGSATDNYYKDAKPVTTKAHSAAASVDYYTSDKGDVGVLTGTNDGVEIKGIKDKDGDNFRVKIKDPHTDKYTTYKLKVAKDGSKMTDEEMTSLDKAVGGLKENSLYRYDGNLWITLKVDDKFMVRKVEGKDSESGQYSKLLDIFEGKEYLPGMSPEDRNKRVKKNRNEYYTKQIVDGLIGNTVRDIVNHQRSLKGD